MSQVLGLQAIPYHHDRGIICICILLPDSTARVVLVRLKVPMYEIYERIDCGGILQDPGVLVSLAEYLLSRRIDIIVAYGIYWYASTPSPPGIAKLILAVRLYSLVNTWWMRGRSSGAGLFSAWYETSHFSEQYRTTSGMTRACLASVLEGFFVVGTLGIGALISMYARCFSLTANNALEGE